jgi:hypothetical protein
MPATNQNAQMVAGDSKTLAFSCLEADGSAANLAGCTLRWWVGRNPKARGTSVLLKKTTSSGISLASASRVLVAIAPADTVSLPPGTYYHELEAIDTGGNVDTLARGSLTIEPTLIV